MTEVALCKGKMTDAHFNLRRAGFVLPGVRRFQQVVSVEIGKDILTLFGHGKRRMKQERVYLKGRPVPRMHTVAIDHTIIPVLVRPDCGVGDPYPLAMTTVLSVGTGVGLGSAYRPWNGNAESAREAIIEALALHRIGGVLVGGRCLRFIMDRGLDFVGELITICLAELDIPAVPLPGYHPELNGHLERFHGVFKGPAISSLAGYTKVPDELDGSRPCRYRYEDLLTESQMICHLREQLELYNLEHRRVADAKTAIERWCDDTTPLDPIDDRVLAHDLLLRKDGVTIGEYGVRLDNHFFVDSQLLGLRRRKVQLRYLPHSRDWVLVFLDGRFLCRAVNQDHLTEDEQEHLIGRRDRRENAGTRVVRSLDAARTDRTKKVKAKYPVVDSSAEERPALGRLAGGLKLLEELDNAATPAPPVPRHHQGRLPL